ncbi:hypothetical protein ACFB49_32670 [Sphingomonas sp. DBB INV C78]|uniref:hypothetical protein n=1 Tax=Sphingomonas sp. DBB INV C78 TaxID=3349434 RepID=UPI0036D28542
MPKFLMTVRSNATPGKDEEYNRWYDEFHVPELLMTPTLVAAQRFRISDVSPADYPGYLKPEFRYLTVYEIESESLEHTREVLWAPSNIARIRKSDAFDSSRVDCSLYVPLGPRVTER